MENSQNLSKNGRLVLSLSEKDVGHKNSGLVQDRKESLGLLHQSAKVGSPAFFPVTQRPESPRSLSRAGTPQLDTIIEDDAADSPSI